MKLMQIDYSTLENLMVPEEPAHLGYWSHNIGIENPPEILNGDIDVYADIPPSGPTMREITNDYYHKQSAHTIIKWLLCFGIVAFIICGIMEIVR